MRPLRDLAPPFVVVSTAALLLAGCATDVRVSPADPARLLEERRESALTSAGLSRTTRDAVAMLDLTAAAERDPVAVASRLSDLAEAEPDAPWRLAAAESLLDAAERSRPPDPSLLLACAREADLALRHALAVREATLDGRAEFAAALYRRAVGRFLAGSRQAWLRDGGVESVEGPGGAFRVRMREAEFPRRFGPGRFDHLLPADFREISGMSRRHRVDGFGAAVVAVREQADATPPREEPFLPPEGLPASCTATLSFLGGGDAIVELWNTDHAATVRRYGADLRLSSDTTAAVAELFARAELVRRGHRGLTDVGAYVGRTGIYLHEPYDPNKIPVLMVHGLRSSPATWRDMLADLRADPALGRRYQFWMFYYPTGLPIPRSAAYLRRELAAARAHFDPERTSAAMDRMVLIGHSMGGLLTKAVLQTSGDTLWNSLHPEPFEEIAMSPEVREHLREVFFYPADERIARAVFIATPHRGSETASSWIGRLGDALVRLPGEFVPVGAWFEAERARLEPEPSYQLTRGVPSSIDDLRPDAPHLRAYQKMPLRPGVPLHVIAGDNGRGTDGVVTVESARFEGADSTLIVESGHDAHTHPLAIREVRRILLEHLGPP